MIHKEEDHMNIHTSMLEDMDKRKVVEEEHRWKGFSGRRGALALAQFGYGGGEYGSRKRG